jgi:hypothetical protein
MIELIIALSLLFGAASTTTTNTDSNPIVQQPTDPGA